MMRLRPTLGTTAKQGRWMGIGTGCGGGRFSVGMMDFDLSLMLNKEKEIMVQNGTSLFCSKNSKKEKETENGET